MKALLFLLTVLLFAGTSLAAKQPELPSDETIVNMVTEIFTEVASASFGFFELISLKNVRISKKTYLAQNARTVPDGTILYPVRISVTIKILQIETEDIDYYMWQDAFDDWRITPAHNL